MRLGVDHEKQMDLDHPYGDWGVNCADRRCVHFPSYRFHVPRMGHTYPAWGTRTPHGAHVPRMGHTQGELATASGEGL